MFGRKKNKKAKAVFPRHTATDAYNIALTVENKKFDEDYARLRDAVDTSIHIKAGEGKCTSSIYLDLIVSRFYVTDYIEELTSEFKERGFDVSYDKVRCLFTVDWNLGKEE